MANLTSSKSWRIWLEMPRSLYVTIWFVLICFASNTGLNRSEVVSDAVPLPSECKLAGRVTNFSGTPLRGVKVSIRGPRGTTVEMITGSEGNYQSPTLEPGRYEVVFESPEGKQKQVVVLNPGPKLGQALPPCGVRVLNVTLGASSPAPTTVPTPLPTATRPPPPSPRPTIANTNTNSNRNGNGNTSNTNQGFNANANAPLQPLSVDEQLENLFSGKIIYKIPQVMRVGENQTIAIQLLKQISTEVEKNANESGKTVADLKLGDTMKVELMALEPDTFEIVRLSPPDPDEVWQAIGGDDASEWTFSVKPTKSGTHTLRILATVQLTNKYQQVIAHSFPTYQNDVRVSTNYWYYTKEFVRSYWQFLMTAILIPLIPLVVRAWRGRRRPDPPRSFEREP